MNSWLTMPPWGAHAVALVALALAVLLVVRIAGERRNVPLRRQVWFGALRVLVLGLLIFIALNPLLVRPRDLPAKPRLIVLLDTSASMGTKDAENRSRLAAALRQLQDETTRQRWETEFTLDTRIFDRETRPADLRQLADTQPLGEGSDIGAAVTGGVAELGELRAQAGVLLISDGRATTEGALDAARLALARAVPLWTYCIGSAVERHDLAIEVTSPETLAFAGADVELSATLRADGYPNRSFQVELLKDDRPIESREIIPDTSGHARVAMRVKAPDAGEHRYVFRVPAQPEEADARNNERAVFLRVVGQKARVLLAEGEPSWDSKFLVQSLKREPHVDLTAVQRVGPQRHVAVVSSAGAENRVEADLFPRTAEQMNQFDVIVLGRGCEAFFDDKTEALLMQFVAQRGGSLLFARGKAYGGRFQPLAKLEPVVWGAGAEPSVRISPTEAGRESPIFDLGSSGSLEELLDRFPAFDQAHATAGEKPLAMVLASAADKGGPDERTVLMASQQYGQGRVLLLNAAGLWRWAFRETGQQESEVAYRRIWISMVQWLLAGGGFLPGADVALHSARRTYTSEQPMQFLVTTKGIDRASYQPRLTIAGAGRSVEVEPRERDGAYVAEAGPFPQGTYQVTLRNNVGKPPEMSMTIEVVDASVERRELSADPQLMKQLATVSGGQALAGSDLGQLGDVVRRWRAARQLSHEQRPVWDRWWVLATMLGMMGVEWWLRRQEGLL